MVAIAAAKAGGRARCSVADMCALPVLGAFDLVTVLGDALNHLPDLGAVGAGLTFWGWSRLRRAKADRPDLTWGQFLYDDLITLGVGCVLIAVVVAIPPEVRDALVRSLLEVAEAISAARGRP